MKRKKLILPIVSTFIVIAGIIVFFIVKSGAFNKAPEVTIKAENRFEQTVTIVMGDDFAPFSFEKNGEYSGYDVELANEIGNRLQMNVNLKFYDWSTCIEKIQSGEADMIMSADYELPMDDISYSIPNTSNPWFAFSSDNTERIDNYADLYGKSIGIGEGTDPLSGSELSENYVIFGSYDEAFKALEEGRVDTVITQYQVGTYIAVKEGYKDIKANCEITGGHMAVGIRADRTDLLDQVNSIIFDMSEDGVLEKLDEKWCGTFVKRYSVLDLWESNPEYFAAAGSVLFIIGALLAMLIARSEEERKESELREKIQVQNHLIKHLIKEYSEVYYIHMAEDKMNDTCELLYKGGILTNDVLPPDETLSFTKKLDYFINNIVFQDDREMVYRKTRREVIIKQISDGEVYYVEFRVPQGEMMHYYQIRFARVEDQKFDGFVIGLRLVDEEVRLREQLDTARTKAEAANNAKTAFLFNMSHDIRTPMNAILGFTDMARKNTDDKEKLMEYLDKAQNAGSLLLSLINSVLEMSRIESGNAEIKEEPSTIMFSFKNVDTTMQSLANEKNIDLSMEFINIKDNYIYCDFDRTNRVFVNLISNAIKYTENGGRVRVKCEQIGRQDDEHGIYRYTVEDNGIGMSEEFQKHMFDEFSRENSSTTSGIQGTGLGLSVTKSFIELMHGTIEFKSEKNKGTTFIVTIPFRLQSDEEIKQYIGHSTENIAKVNAVNETGNELSLEGKRILLVEDNEMNREIAAFILEDEGIIVEEADDGTVAVELLKEKGGDYYDAVLMDIQMPVMNGYDATRIIRQMYPDAKLPIIALSANAFAEDKAASIEAGMNGHIAKPINNDVLIGVLTKLL